MPEAGRGRLLPNPSADRLIPDHHLRATAETEARHDPGMSSARALALLGSPVRWRIVELLASGQSTSGEVADAISTEFAITREATSQQLAVLARAGLIECERDATARLYRLSPRLIGALQALVERLVDLREPARYDDLGTEASAGLERAPHPDDVDGEGCWCIRKSQELAPVSTRASPMYTLGGW